MKMEYLDARLTEKGEQQVKNTTNTNLNLNALVLFF